MITDTPVIHLDSTLIDLSGVGLPTQITKRDGRIMEFDANRIRRAIHRCFEGIDRKPQGSIDDLLYRVLNAISMHPEMPSVEGIQNIVETTLAGAGEFEAAKAYILYRAEHARLRNERPIPLDIKEKFNESDTYFPTQLQKFQFFDKYSRWRDDLGRRETWPETVDRAVSFLHELVTENVGTEVASGMVAGNEFGRIRQFILEMKAMPSMRLLAMAGPAARRQHASIYNCLGGETKFLTDKGPRSLAEMVGQSVNVLAVDGAWRPADICRFGEQVLNEVTLGHYNGGKHGNQKFVTRATANHRWLLQDGTVTTALKVGDKLLSPGYDWKVDETAVRHGFVYGDGTVTRSNGVEYAQVRLCGKKAALVDSVFSGYGRSYPPSFGGEPIIYCGRDAAVWKQLPIRTDSEYVAGFIKGLELSDGSSQTTAGNMRISTQKSDLVDWLKANAGMAGLKVLSDQIVTKPTNYGERSAPLHFVLLGSGSAAILQVEKIENVDPVPEEVYCAVEPVTNSFTLANGQVTGNCSLVSVDSVDAFVETLLLSMSGCGVGFSVERRHVDKLPAVEVQREGVPISKFRVSDSTEGWGDAVRTGLSLWFNGYDVDFDFSEVRPAGTPLKIKGGRASGPDPLRNTLAFARERILARQGSRLRPLDAHDIMCQIGTAAVSGGVRRTALISLFDIDDMEMANCKVGDFETHNSQRWNANNSAVIPENGISQAQFLKLWTAMVESQRGEPGFVSRQAMKSTLPERRKWDPDFGVNPCGEIIIRPMGLCNLSIAVARNDDTFQTLKDKVEVAAIIGTIQSLATHFPGLRPQWAENAREERLLGVDITGQRDCPLLEDPDVLSELREHAISTNRVWAELFGINQAAAVTTVKPSGNSSVLLDCASGLHPRWARYYERNVRVSATSPIYKVLRDAGVPLQPENGQEGMAEPNTYVASFVVKAPDGTPVREDLTALDQANYWLHVKQNWTEHNPSITCQYRPDEMIQLMSWVWDHIEMLGGMSFLPFSGVRLSKLPYVEISQDEYEERSQSFPPIDFSRLVRYENADQTIASTELACVSGLCET